MQAVNQQITNSGCGRTKSIDIKNYKSRHDEINERFVCFVYKSYSNLLIFFCSFLQKLKLINLQFMKMKLLYLQYSILKVKAMWLRHLNLIEIYALEEKLNDFFACVDANYHSIEILCCTIDN